MKVEFDRGRHSLRKKTHAVNGSEPNTPEDHPIGTAGYGKQPEDKSWYDKECHMANAARKNNGSFSCHATCDGAE